MKAVLSVIASNGVPSHHIRSAGSHSNSGMKKEGKNKTADKSESSNSELLSMEPWAAAKKALS